MSYASSDKSFPNFLKSLPQKLSQPTAIAVIASVGIHAALGLSLPYLPISSKETPKPVRNVQLLDLKPEELSRLPPPPLPLDGLPPSINQQLKPLSPSSPSGSRLPLPSSSQDKNLSLGDLPLDPLQSLGGSSWKVPRRDIRNSPLRKDLTKQSNEPPLPSEVFNSQPGKFSKNPQFNIYKGSKITNSSNIRRDLGSLTRSLLPSNDEPLLRNTINPNQISRPLPPPPPPAEAITLAPPGSTGTQFQNPYGATTSIQSPGQTTQATVPALGQTGLAGNSGDPNRDAVMRNTQNWYARNQVIDRPETIKISRNYPQTPQAAGQSNGGAVLVGVKVDENGKIISDSVEVIGSSFPNDAFDQEAISSVRGYQFPRIGKSKAYFVQVQFRNDNPVPGSVTGSPTPTEGKTSTQQPNPSNPLTPTEGKTSTQQRNSSEPSTPIQQSIPPERQNAPEWSKPVERNIPSLPQNSKPLSTPTEGKNPTERPNFAPPSTPTEGKNSTERPSSSPRSIPIEQLAPPKRDNATERVTPTEQITPPKRDNATERVTPTEQITPPKRDNATERATPTEQITPPKRDNATERATPIERQNSTERQNSSERKTPVEQRISPEPRSSSDSTNSKKPQKLPEPQSSEKPQRLPSPPNSIKP